MRLVGPTSELNDADDDNNNTQTDTSLGSGRGGQKTRGQSSGLVAALRASEIEAENGADNGRHAHIYGRKGKAHECLYTAANERRPSRNETKRNEERQDLAQQQQQHLLARGLSAR